MLAIRSLDLIVDVAFANIMSNEAMPMSLLSGVVRDCLDSG
jgi:hypothetical protein